LGETFAKLDPALPSARAATIPRRSRMGLPTGTFAAVSSWSHQRVCRRAAVMLNC
jgi:hypothetical protein